MITKDMIRTCIRNGSIRLGTDPNMDSGTVCKIGDNWFYFGGETAEEMEPEAYLRAVPMDDVIDEIFLALEDFRQDGDDEYAYYEAYLSEWTAIRMATLRERDDTLEQLWEQFADVPMDPDTEKMEGAFLHFPAGTDREEIWHWFDERHSKGVAYLLYHDGVDRTMETANLLYCKQLCTECDSETCLFNPKGICMVPFITGKAPGVHDDGCTDYRCREEVL